MSECEPHVIQARQIVELHARIKDLEEGMCRFHCRTAKDNWIDGWLWHDDNGYTREETEEFYNEWRKRQRS